MIIVIIGALIALLLTALPRAREASNRESCQNNLKQWGAIFKMYASESKGYYSRCATKNERTNTSTPGHGFVAAPFGPSLYPKYVSDLNMYFCPSSKVKAEDYTKYPSGRWCNISTAKLDARNFNDCSYSYYGWAATNDNEFATMITCLFLADLKDSSSDPQTADKDLRLEDFGGRATVQATISTDLRNRLSGTPIPIPIVTGTGYSACINRLKEGVERFLITEIHGISTGEIYQSRIPIMWDRLNNSPEDFPRVPGGYNVLYMDGHVEFIRYSYSRPPITKMFAALSRVID